MGKKIELTNQELLQLKELHSLRYTDTLIGERMGYNRKIIGKFRKLLGLPSYKEAARTFIKEVQELASKGYGVAKIAKELHLSPYIVEEMVEKNNIEILFQFVLTKDMKERLLELYDLGKMDSEIAEELGIKRLTVMAYRKYHNLPTKFTYDKISKIDNLKFEELFNQGLSDYKIADMLGMSPDGVYSHRLRHGYLREKLIYNKELPLTDFLKEILIGTVLGDSSLRLTSGNKSAYLSCSHGLKLKDYCIHKAEIFKSIGAEVKYHRRNTPDKRNNKFYEDYTLRTPSNPALLEFYYAFYPNGLKIIPTTLLPYFTEISLAYLFMDDGFKQGDTYCIATNCFSEENISQFREFLLTKFNLETTMNNSHVIRIRNKSAIHFKELVSLYIHECLKYKL